MATESEHIHLHGGRARKFREIKESIEDDLGYSVSKPRVVDELLEDYNGKHWD